MAGVISAPATSRRRAARDLPSVGRPGRREECTEAPPRARQPTDLVAPQAPAPHGVTLDDVLSSAWEALSAHEAASCPICGSAMRPRFGSGSAVLGGVCSGCATVIR